MKEISIFDADACILMGNTLPNGHSQLSELVLYFDENYIHQFVLDEVSVYSNIRTHLNQLIDQKLIEVIDDKLILSFLKDQLAGSEMAACSFFCSQLVANINMMKPKEKAILQVQYKLIINNNYASISKLLNDLNSVESCMPNQTSAGELKTSILVDVLYFIGIAEINFFVSNDKRARGLIFGSTSGRVKTSSPIGTFILFRDVGISKDEALDYLKKLGSNRGIKVIDNDKKWITKKYSDIFEDIYSQASTIYLTPDGYVHY